MMEISELLELFINEDYQKVIENADFCTNFNAKSLKLKSFIALGKPKAALQYYEQNRKILEESDFKKSLELLIYLLLNNGYPKEVTKKIMDAYKDAPNLNYEQYEFVNGLDKEIEDQYFIKQMDEKSEEEKSSELKSYLENNDIDALIDFMNTEDYSMYAYDYIHEICSYLHKNQELTLLNKILFEELIKIAKDEVFTSVSNGKYARINPKDYTQDFMLQNDLLKEAANVIYEDEKDISILSVFARILNKGACAYFPNFIKTQDEARIFCAASLALAYKLFDYDFLASPFALEAYSFHKEELQKFYSLIYNSLIKN